MMKIVFIITFSKDKEKCKSYCLWEKGNFFVFEIFKILCFCAGWDVKNSRKVICDSIKWNEIWNITLHDIQIWMENSLQQMEWIISWAQAFSWFDGFYVVLLSMVLHSFEFSLTFFCFFHWKCLNDSIFITLNVLNCSKRIDGNHNTNWRFWFTELIPKQFHWNEIQWTYHFQFNADE